MESAAYDTTDASRANDAELDRAAQRNLTAFEAILAGYVSQKLAYVIKRLEHGAREVSLDATDCVWCVFDDPSFGRCEVGRAWFQEAGSSPARHLQVYRGLGDVVMPEQCDVSWVARRIADEALRQLRQKGYRCSLEKHRERDESHLVLVVRPAGLLSRIAKGLMAR